MGGTKAILSLVALSIVVALLWHLGLNSVFGVIGVDTPVYEVLRKGNGYEIRRYAISTAVATDGNGRGGSSFMRLAGFIGVMGNPQNTKKQTISMTAPVVTIPSSKGEEMQFILPSAIHGSAPQPIDQNVRLVTRPPSVFAVETFSGQWSVLEAKERADRLRIKVQADGYTVDEQASWQYFRYNPPWTIPFF